VYGLNALATWVHPEQGDESPDAIKSGPYKYNREYFVKQHHGVRD
jgi:hypothetical protein